MSGPAVLRAIVSGFMRDSLACVLLDVQKWKATITVLLWSHG
jgi:hypothetical protein